MIPLLSPYVSVRNTMCRACDCRNSTSANNGRFSLLLFAFAFSFFSSSTLLAELAPAMASLRIHPSSLCGDQQGLPRSEVTPSASYKPMLYDTRKEYKSPTIRQAGVGFFAASIIMVRNGPGCVARSGTMVIYCRVPLLVFSHTVLACCQSSVFDHFNCHLPCLDKRSCAYSLAILMTRSHLNSRRLARYTALLFINLVC
jgi:hypothetical protein